MEILQITGVHVIRRIVGISVAVVGLVLAARLVFSGQHVSALALALAAVFSSLVVFLSFEQVITDRAFVSAASVIGVIGMIGTLIHHRGFDGELQGAHYEALSSMAAMELSCRTMPLDQRRVRDRGVLACAIQGDADLISAAVELEKGMRLGPVLSVADAAYSARNGDRPDNCARAFKMAFEFCPQAFFSMSATYRNALLQAAE